MLSDRLEALAAHFVALAAKPMPLSLDPTFAALVADELADAANAARSLEGRPVPPHFRGDLMAANVVILADARKQQRKK
jgi:hypothetical protein